MVTWTASVSDAAAGALNYAFRVRTANRAYQTLVDFGPKASLDWTTIQHEGAYEMQVSVKNTTTGDQAVTSVQFTFTSLVNNNAPTITPTANPLVFIYSVPPCANGGRIRVQFQSANGSSQNTPWQGCRPAYTSNLYLAGLRATMQYTAHHMLDSGTDITAGPDVAWTTPAITIQPPPVSLVNTTTTPTVDGILLQSIFGTSAIATDLAGNIVWYSPGDITFLTRAQTGGTFLAIGEDGTLDSSHQFFREFDLAGVTIAETNAAQVSLQLTALGVHAINGFHHEARKLPNGNYLVLADSERILTDVQGAGPVDVIGDTIIVLDPNLRVVWTWDAFDHLDNSRAAVLAETCNSTSGLACAPFYLAPVANDWLHGNSLQLTPDGQILYSARHQDWLIKINYDNGTGDGTVIWRLGNGGDFQIVSSDTSPWFSHQHDANFEPNNTLLTVFDDGNTRTLTTAGNSRGQALTIDEPNRKATLILNADLGTYSPAVGSAQRLPNGHYHFDSGFFLDPGGSDARFSQSVEVNASGKIVYGIQFGAIEYRSFRMRDLYTEP